MYVAGVPFKWNDKDLHDCFMRFGNVLSSQVACELRPLLRLWDMAGHRPVLTRSCSDAKVALAKEGDHAGKPGGYGFVVFESLDDARTAIEETNGRSIQGRKVRIPKVAPLVCAQPSRVGSVLMAAVFVRFHSLS